MLDLIAPWADQITAACLFVFAAALVPVIWSGRKKQEVPYVTSGLMAAGELFIGVALHSVDLLLSAALCYILTVGWGILVVQRAVQRRGK